MACKYGIGDLIGFSACTRLGITINLGTWGIPGYGLSHVALVGPHPCHGRPILYESTSIYDQHCILQGRKVDGVQAHEILPRVLDYRRRFGRVWHYPLVRELWPEQREALLKSCIESLGTPYDNIGAFRANDLPLNTIGKLLFSHEDLVSMFCSEFCAARHRDARVFACVNASAWSPNSLTRAERRRGILGRPIELFPQGCRS